MIIWLQGAEQPTNARLAESAGATHLAVAFWGLSRRLGKKPWLASERFSDPTRVMISSGGHAARDLSGEDLRRHLQRFEDLVEENQSRLSAATEMDHPGLDLVAHRWRMKAMLGDRFIPVWQEQSPVRDLEALAEEYPLVGLRAEAVRSSTALSARLSPLRARYGTRWHLLDGARAEDLMTGRFASAATVGWLSPMRFGETIVWDGTRLQRYQKRMKDQARRRHQTTFSRAGFDADKILSDDHEEITRFTVWSYQQLEKYVSRPGDDLPPNVVPILFSDRELSTSPTGNEPGTQMELPPNHVDKSMVESRNAPTLPKVRERGQVPLPVVGLETRSDIETDADGNRVLVDRSYLKKNSGSLRACDTCHVAATCPAFNPGYQCAYNFPVEVKTKEQLNSLLQGLIEMQAERVAFMMMQEQLNGGYADPNASEELERMVGLIEKVKRIQDDRDYVKFQVEGRAGGGVIEQVFGARAKQMRDLDAPLIADRIIEQVIE